MVLKITNLHILRYLPTYWLYLLERHTIDNQRCTHTASASDIVYQKTVELAEPVKGATLSEILGMERKAVDIGMKHLKEDGKASTPTRGYWEIVP